MNGRLVNRHGVLHASNKLGVQPVNRRTYTSGSNVVDGTRRKSALVSDLWENGDDQMKEKKTLVRVASGRVLNEHFMQIICCCTGSGLGWLPL